MLPAERHGFSHTRSLLVVHAESGELVPSGRKVETLEVVLMSTIAFTFQSFRSMIPTVIKYGADHGIRPRE